MVKVFQNSIRISIVFRLFVRSTASRAGFGKQQRTFSTLAESESYKKSVPRENDQAEKRRFFRPKTATRNEKATPKTGNLKQHRQRPNNANVKTLKKDQIRAETSNNAVRRRPFNARQKAAKRSLSSRSATKRRSEVSTNFSKKRSKKETPRVTSANYFKAEAAYRRAQELKSKDSRAIYGLGNIYSDQQRWEEAEKAYRQAIALEPTAPKRISL